MEKEPCFSKWAFPEISYATLTAATNFALPNFWPIFLSSKRVSSSKIWKNNAWMNLNCGPLWQIEKIVNTSSTHLYLLEFSSQKYAPHTVQGGQAWPTAQTAAAAAAAAWILEFKKKIFKFIITDATDRRLRPDVAFLHHQQQIRSKTKKTKRKQ